MWSFMRICLVLLRWRILNWNRGKINFWCFKNRAWWRLKNHRNCLLTKEREVNFWLWHFYANRFFNYGNFIDIWDFWDLFYRFLFKYTQINFLNVKRRLRLNCFLFNFYLFNCFIQRLISYCSNSCFRCRDSLNFFFFHWRCRNISKST